jgi:hypothetical protein
LVWTCHHLVLCCMLLTWGQVRTGRASCCWKCFIKLLLDVWACQQPARLLLQEGGAGQQPRARALHSSPASNRGRNGVTAGLCCASGHVLCACFGAPEQAAELQAALVVK